MIGKSCLKSTKIKNTEIFNFFMFRQLKNCSTITNQGWQKPKLLCKNPWITGFLTFSNWTFGYIYYIYIVQYFKAFILLFSVFILTY